MKRHWILLSLVLLFSGTALAQNPCSNPETVRLLRQGATITVTNCDSLYVLSKKKFEDMAIAEAYYQNLIDQYKGLTEKLDETIVTRDALVDRQAAFIAKQDSAIARYEVQLDTATTLVERSTKNTDAALSELRKQRWKTVLYVIGSVGLGYVIGKN